MSGTKCIIYRKKETNGLLIYKKRWKDNGVPFGWSIEQYQAWARGTLTVTEATKLFIQVNGMSEFYIDGKRYSGDAYDYRKITHLVYLERGVHIIDVRMVHDIRVFGGGKTPQCKFHIHIDAKTDTLVYPEDCAVIIPSNMGEIVLPDYLNDIGFAGSFGSVSIQNAGDDPIVVKSITLCIVDEHTLSSRTKSGLFIEVTHLRS
jgi:hypothetical protein